MHDSSPHELWRMDWGFGNPNKTAALIALVMIAVWAFAHIRKWGVWAALTLFTGFGACLILTQSRGGLIGMIAGGLILLAWTPHPFPFWRSLGVIIVCAGLGIFALMINAQSRYTEGISGKDLSIENRLLIWERVPSMIHDAPNGWGLGKSGDAYMQWYQPITRGEGYRTLVNSHFTWLVELNCWGRIAYIALWAFALVLVWPQSDFRWFSIPLALWIVWGICAFFSSVAEAPLLWTIPAMALISVLCVRLRKRVWPSPSLWLRGVMAWIVIVGGILFSGIWVGTPSCVYSPYEGIVTLGSKLPKIWIVAPNQGILGEHYGHEIRRGFDAEPICRQMGLGIVSELKNAPKNQILVFSGHIPSTFGAATPSQVIFINPDPVSSVTIQVLTDFPKVTVIVGEYSQNKDYWNEQARSHPNIKLQLVEGSEEYISNWMREIATAIQG
jgi:O-Antigen ligase